MDPAPFPYVGPQEIRDGVRPGRTGRPISSPGHLDDWLREREPAEAAEPFTYVVLSDGVLLLAPRRGEHVECAGGEPVAAAGEMAFGHGAAGWTVTMVSNQSAGYCPDVTSWTAVAAALDTAGIERPPGFTHDVVFRRCPRCGERQIVKDGDFTCVFCGTGLPAQWNIPTP